MTSASSRGESWRHALVHLRLPFSVVLTPLFAWGVYLAVPRPVAWLHVLWCYLLVHGPLYGSLNAFNSYYDRDDGPIGSLEAPPPVDRQVLLVALLCKALSLGLALMLDPRFAVLVLVAIGFSVGYSHPRWRWKTKPLAAALSIWAFQGVLGALFGWTAATWQPGSPQPLATIWPPGWLNGLAVLGVACWTLGFYPLTGVYQIDNDRRAGIRTLAVALGVDGSFGFAAVVAPLGGLAVLAVLLSRGAYLSVAVCGLYVLLAVWHTWRWRQRFAAQSTLENQRALMRLSYGNGAVFSMLFALLIAASQ